MQLIDPSKHPLQRITSRLPAIAIWRGQDLIAVSVSGFFKKMHRNIGLLIALGAYVNACQRDLYEAHFGHNPQFVKRQAADFPPVLTEQESVLVNSFDNASINDWS